MRINDLVGIRIQLYEHLQDELARRGRVFLGT